MFREEIDRGEFDTSTLEALAEAAKELTAKFTAQHIVLLHGSMGAGKTQWVRAVTERFQCKEVASPTFAFHYEYEMENGHIDHLDLYRIESEDELESIGFWDLFSQKNGWVFIEWAEKISRDELPLNWPIIEIKMSVSEDQSKRSLSWVSYAAG